MNIEKSLLRAFFEAYFSNFIEGTEFTIDEAENIAFQGMEINNRHADSHDILANFTLCNDYSEMSTTPRNPAELLDILQKRHAYIMRERPDKRPGSFKEKPNKVGNTYFVPPKEVVGTLSQGFEYYHLLNDGIEKALFMHLLISEVHPFDDGNGRLSRIMMNAELVKAGLFKIIIPSAHRDNYLNGVRLASRDYDFRIYCKVVDQAQAYVESVNWHHYGEAREKIEKDRANLTSDEGLPEFNRALKNLILSDFPAS
jgi:Fic family protein